MSKWIRKEDKVVVISGNDKGKIGVVLARKNDRILIQGVNIRKKHAKRRTQGASSEILEIERPIHISNVALCNGDGRPIKLKVRFNASGQKELYYKEKDKEILFREVKKK